MVHDRVVGPIFQSSRARFLFCVAFIVQVRHHSAEGPHLRVVRIDRFDLLQFLFRLFVFLRVHQMLHHQYPRGNVILVPFQNFLERLQHFFPIARRERFGQAVQHVWVILEFLQTFLERFARQRIVMLLQGEVSDGQVDLAQVRIAAFDRSVEVVQHQLRIGAEKDRCFSQCDEIDGFPARTFGSRPAR